MDGRTVDEEQYALVAAGKNVPALLDALLGRGYRDGVRGTMSELRRAGRWTRRKRLLARGVPMGGRVGCGLWDS